MSDHPWKAVELHIVRIIDAGEELQRKIAFHVDHLRRLEAGVLPNSHD